MNMHRLQYQEKAKFQPLPLETPELIQPSPTSHFGRIGNLPIMTIIPANRDTPACPRRYLPDSDWNQKASREASP